LVRCGVALRQEPTAEAVTDCERAAADALRGDNIAAAAVAWAGIFAAETQNLGHPEIGERFALLADAAAEVADDPAVFGAIAHARATALGMTDLPAALEQARLALKWEVEAHGPEYPGVARRKLSVVHYLGALERREEALGLVREARAAIEATFGPDHPAVAGAWMYESRLLGVTADRAAALSAGERAIDGLTRLYGRDDDLTLRARMDVAFLHGTSGHVAEGVAELEATLPKLRAYRAAPDPGREADYAFLLQQAGRSEEAIAVCHWALAAAREIPGGDRAMVTTHWRCGDIHFHRTELDEALAQWEAALAIAQKVQGPDSPFAVDLARMIDDARMEWNKPPRRGANDPR